MGSVTVLCHSIGEGAVGKILIHSEYSTTGSGNVPNNSSTPDTRCHVLHPEPTIFILTCFRRRRANTATSRRGTAPSKHHPPTLSLRVAMSIRLTSSTRRNIENGPMSECINVRTCIEISIHDGWSHQPSGRRWSPYRSSDNDARRSDFSHDSKYQEIQKHTYIEQLGDVQELGM